MVHRALPATLALALAATVAANPVPLDPTPVEMAKRATYTTCDSFGSYTTGNYIVYQNLWGASAGTGSQCLSLNSVGSSLAWDTTWSWSGGSSSVKSYDNIAYSKLPVQLSTVTSIPTTWDWTITGSSIVADVSYDIMTSSSASGSNDYEIMIWLDALGGAGPISSTGSPVATPTIDGYTWKLFSGPNGATTVYSFVAETAITSFSSDLKAFFTYLNENEGFSLSQYLTVLESGTEPFTGSGVTLTTTKYSIAVDT